MFTWCAQPKSSWKQKVRHTPQLSPVAKSTAHMTPLWSMAIEECHIQPQYFPLGILAWKIYPKSSWKVKQKVCTQLSPVAESIAHMTPLSQMLSAAHWLQPRACCKWCHRQRQSSNSNVITACYKYYFFRGSNGSSRSPATSELYQWIFSVDSLHWLW